MQHIISVDTICPKVSIVIPVYNTSDYLRKCLDSVVNQTFNDIEVICIDDGSTDSSLDILTEYSQKDSRFTVVVQNRQGAGSARNRGLNIANGDFVCFLDSDDFLELNMIELLYNTAIENSCDIVICNAFAQSDDDKILCDGKKLYPVINNSKIEYNKIFHWTDYGTDILFNFSVVPWNKLYSRKMIIENDLWFQNLPSCNDVGFGYVVRFLANRIIVIEDPLVNHVVMRNGSISHNRGQSATSVVDALLFLRTFLEKKELFDDFSASFGLLVKKLFTYQKQFCNDNELFALIIAIKKSFPDIWDKYRKFFYVDSCIYFDKYISGKKVFLWGASNYLKKILEKLPKRNNIIGIIDSDEQKSGKLFCGYKIYSPEYLRMQKSCFILSTIQSNSNKNYLEVQGMLDVLNKDLMLLPNYFD